MNEKEKSWEETAVELSQGKSVFESAKEAKEVYILDLKTEIAALESAIAKAEMSERRAKQNYNNSAFAIFEGEMTFKSYITNRDNLYNQQKTVEDNVRFLKESLEYRKTQLTDLKPEK